MRMMHALNESTTEGAHQVKQTGVGGDAKIVYMLLTGQVSDKIVYPVREYATNAWEVSPASKPFEIELPTRFNLEYRIRDFGPGLSHSFMMNRYAKIGDSTKDGDDQAVGGWGLGSKSGLAYLMRSDGCGALAVISRFRGFRRSYIINISDQGKIQIQFLGEWPLEPEDRGTGLEISFPVRPEDAQRFRDHAQAVLWSFEPRPKITPAIDFGEPKVIHSGNGWRVYDPRTVPFQGPQVKVGPVMYPINMHLAPSTDMVAHNTTIVFDAPIGSISMSASRENLQYDDRTESGLRALFDHYRTDWFAAAQAAVEQAPTYFEARWKAADVTASLPTGNGYNYVSNLTWRGFRFNEKLFSEHHDVVKAGLWPEMRPSYGDGPTHFRRSYDINPGRLQDRTVVIQHGTDRSFERIQAAGLEQQKLIWVRCKRRDLDLALDAMGRPDYVLLDDIKLDKVVRGPREKRPESEKRYRILSSDFKSSPTEWIDTDEEHVYAYVDGRGYNRLCTTRVDGVRRELRASAMADAVRSMTNLKLLDSTLDIVCLKEGEEPLPHWRTLGDHLAEILEAKIDPTKVRPVIPWSDGSFPATLRQLKELRVDLTLAPQDLLDVYAEMIKLGEYRETLNTPTTDHDTMAALLLTISGTDLKTTAKDPTQPIRDAWKLIEPKYPLIPMIFRKQQWGRDGYILNKEGQADMNHYFELLAK